MALRTMKKTQQGNRIVYANLDKLLNNGRHLWGGGICVKTQLIKQNLGKEVSCLWEKQGPGAMMHLRSNCRQRPG